MTLGKRVFVFNDDGTVLRMPLRSFDKIMMPNGRAVPEFAGKRIKTAYVLLETEGRKPKRIRQIDYYVYGFGADGRLDQSEWTERMRTASDMFEGKFCPSFLKPKNPDILESLRPTLAHRKNEDKFKWKPTPAQQHQVEKMAMGLPA